MDIPRGNLCALGPPEQHGRLVPWAPGHGKIAAHRSHRECKKLLFGVHAGEHTILQFCSVQEAFESLEHIIAEDGNGRVPSQRYAANRRPGDLRSGPIPQAHYYGFGLRSILRITSGLALPLTMSLTATKSGNCWSQPLATSTDCTSLEVSTPWSF